MISVRNLALSYQYSAYFPFWFYDTVRPRDTRFNTGVFFSGYNGFDPKFKSMHPFFLAIGPAFKSNVTMETIRSVDVYALMCEILGLTPAPNDGSLDNVKPLLKVEADTEPHTGREKTTFTTTWVSCKIDYKLFIETLTITIRTY